MSNAKQRLTLNNLSEPQQMRELNRQLSWIWDQLLGGLSMKSLSSGTRAVIDSKASCEDVDELGNQIGEVSSSLTQTAEQIRSEVSDTVSGLQSQIDQQAGQISLRVTEQQLADGLDGKLDADAPSVGVDTRSGIVINENGVYVEGNEIDLRTSDGDEYVNISEAGVSASNVSAPNVMPRYDGYDYMVAIHTEGSLAYANHYRSLQDIFNQLSGKVVDKAIDIDLEFSDVEYGSFELHDAVFLEPLGIYASAGHAPTLAGTISIRGCSGDIFIDELNITPVNGGNGIEVDGSVYVEATNCILTGNGSGYGMIKYRGGELYTRYCEFYNFSQSIVARAGAHITAIECKGNCTINADKGGIISTCGYMPSATASFAPVESWGGKVFTDNTYVDQGSVSSAPTPVTTASAAYLSVNHCNYESDGSAFDQPEVLQGWYYNTGRIRGCMWFDNAAIRSAISGKNVLSASLRLSMKSGVGRGTSVIVALSGTAAVSGADSAAVTKSYGTIGTTNPGGVTTITIPNQVVTDLVNGTINGLMLYSDDTGAYKERSFSKNYAKFDGSGADDSLKPMLTVTYQG